MSTAGTLVLRDSRVGREGASAPGGRLCAAATFSPCPTCGSGSMLVNRLSPSMGAVSVSPPSWSLVSPMRMRASRVDSWFGFSRRRAFCVAARWVGDGGRGAGFMVCATARGIVGMLQDEITGSAKIRCCQCRHLVTGDRTHWYNHDQSWPS